MHSLHGVRVRVRARCTMHASSGPGSRRTRTVYVHTWCVCAQVHGACVQGAHLERELLELLLLLVERRLERALLRGDPLHLVRVRLRSHRVEEGWSTHSAIHRVRGRASHRVRGIVPGYWQPSPRPWQRPRPPRAASSSPPSRSRRSRTHLVRVRVGVRVRVTVRVRVRVGLTRRASRLTVDLRLDDHAG